MNKQTFIIKDATVHDGLGHILNNYDVLIANGRFIEIKPNLDHLRYPTLDASGLDMFPGFIAPLSPWGGSGPALHAGNLSEHSSLLTPDLDVTCAFQADSIAYQQLYQWGITATCLTPDFTNVLSGLAAVYKTYAPNHSKYLLRDKVFMAASFSSLVKQTHAGKRYAETDMGLLHLFLQALSEAVSSEGDTADHKSSPLKAVVHGEIPLLICCDNRDMWQRVSRELSGYPHLRYMLCGSYDIRSEDLKAEGATIPYIQFSMADAPWNLAGQIDFKQLKALLRDPFLAASSPYLLESEMSHAEACLWNAAMMYKHGIDAENIVRSLCNSPAKILGVDDRIGSISAGRDADFSLWCGHPVTSFESQLKHVFVDGTEVTKKEVQRFCW